ncbi:MAG: branched-chain amino acid ABC transporter permease [Rhodobacteraceae bacterium]|nr:branched-chain amino acid ABC transporter permease [Paracoccaceae bacterium]
MSKPLPNASGHFRRSHADEFRLIETGFSRTMLALFIIALVSFPFLFSSFYVDLAAQVFLASIGALSLMLLTGIAGQISLGHAGLIAAGAFTAGILFKEFALPFWVTIPAAALVGAGIGVLFGLPSLRLRGLYLAVSTLALHFIVVFLGGEYETRRGFSTGILIDPPVVFGYEVYSTRAWYFTLAVAAAVTLWICINLMRSRSGRAWKSIHANETVAEAIGIGVTRYKLLAFVVSSSMTAVAGALFAYYRGFVSIEAFSLYLTIQYVAMIIIGGMGSLLGALLGAVFVTLFPYIIEALVSVLPGADRLAGSVFAFNYAAFGIVMILFLVFEPQGLVGIWRRIRDYFVLWPFRFKAMGGRK